MQISLKGKKAIVAGASQGIGLAVARQLAFSGAEVCLLARNEDRLKRALSELDTGASQEHRYLIADFSDASSLQRCLDELNTEDLQFDILVNNTGGPKPGPAHKAELTEFNSAFQQHLICNHILAAKLIPGMKERGYGRILNVISTSVKQPLPNLGVSNTIRGAVANWSKTLANELAQFGITVNNLLPGATSTERLSGIIQNKSQKTGLSVKEATNSMLAEIPAGRFGSPEELGYVACFLSSDLAGYINGVNIPVDGGRTGCL